MAVKRIFGIECPEKDGEQWNPLVMANLCFHYPFVVSKSNDPAVRAMRKVDWYWYLVGVYWGEKAPKRFIRHPWAEEMAESACETDRLSLSGCASSGKTDFGATWLLLNWQADPFNVKCLVTSTSLKEARKRVWGSIREYFQGSAVPMPGKLLDSVGQIRSQDGPLAGSDKTGLELIAAEQSQEKDAVKRLIGIKQKRVILFADELPELTHGILSAMANLESNPNFSMIAAGNFKSMTDPFGVFSEPAGGWGSVNIETTRWETKNGGICIRFDGTKSPNLKFSTDKWPIYGRKVWEEHRRLGENSIQFWRMCRSFPAPAGVQDVIYAESELSGYGAIGDGPLWSDRPKMRMASLDAAFTSGGDASAHVKAELGWDTEGKMVLRVIEAKPLREDVSQPVSYDKQVGLRFKEECEQSGIDSWHAAYDATGAGISFGTLMGELWDGKLLGVKFGGAASDSYVESAGQMVPANEVYANRVSELWYQGKEYMRRGQIKGIPSIIMEEMTQRKYTVQKGAGTRILVEPKSDMKLRLGRSPDFADAFFILIELARTRFGFVPHGQAAEPSQGWEELDDQPDKSFSEDCILEDSYAT